MNLIEQSTCSVNQFDTSSKSIVLQQPENKVLQSVLNDQSDEHVA